MRVVLDTNIFISALLSPFSHPGAIYRDWRLKRFELVTSEWQIAELQRVSRYPRIATRIPPHEIGIVVNSMRKVVYTSPIPRKHTCTDPDDAYLLDLADISAADFLITGDQRAGLLSRKRVARASILSAKAFAAALNL